MKRLNFKTGTDYMMYLIREYGIEKALQYAYEYIYDDHSMFSLDRFPDEKHFCDGLENAIKLTSLIINRGDK